MQFGPLKIMLAQHISAESDLVHLRASLSAVEARLDQISPTATRLVERSEKQSGAWDEEEEKHNDRKVRLVCTSSKVSGCHISSLPEFYR